MYLIFSGPVAQLVGSKRSDRNIISDVLSENALCDKIEYDNLSARYSVELLGVNDCNKLHKS